MIHEMTKNEFEQFVQETDEMLDNGTAEIVMQNPDMIMIRRLDSSGFIFTADRQLYNFRFMNSEDKEIDFQKMIETIRDRKPDNEADDLLRQVFG